MLRLFKIEWSKLLQSRSFSVLIIIYSTAFMLTSMALSSIYRRLKIDVLENLSEISDYNPFAFPDIWVITCYMAQWFTLLVAIIVISLVVNEFSFRTARQHIIDGLSRLEFVLGKFITVIMVSVIVTIIIFLLGGLVGLMKNGGAGSITFDTIFPYFFAIFVRTLGLLTFAMFMAMWIKRTGVTILLYILIQFGLVATIIRNFTDGALGDFLPIGVFNRLIRGANADMDTFDNFTTMSLTDFIQIAPTGQFVLSFIYIGVFVSLSYVVIRRNDLK